MNSNHHSIIVGLSLFVLVLSIVVLIQGKKQEMFSYCVDPINSNYDGIQCLPSKGFQEKCIRYTQDNQTVYPSYIPSACAQGESTLLSVGI